SSALPHARTQAYTYEHARWHGWADPTQVSRYDKSARPLHIFVRAITLRTTLASSATSSVYALVFSRHNNATETTSQSVETGTFMPTRAASSPFGLVVLSADIVLPYAKLGK
ncbi:unnamed protein product, partial [Protopolystoma xenopodis]